MRASGNMAGRCIARIIRHPRWGQTTSEFLKRGANHRVVANKRGSPHVAESDGEYRHRGSHITYSRRLTALRAVQLPERALPPRRVLPVPGRSRTIKVNREDSSTGGVRFLRGRRPLAESQRFLYNQFMTQRS